MRPIAKTDFSKLSSAAMATVDEVLEIRSVNTPLGYFVPTSTFDKLLAGCKQALGAFEHNWAIDWGELEQAIAQAEGRGEGQ